MIEEDLKTALIETADFFKVRGIHDWESEAREAAKKAEIKNLDFVDDLWIRYAPTCDIDDLLITEYAPENEVEINKLNNQLAEISNKLFALLDKAKNEKT